MTCKPAFIEEFQEKLDDTRYANIRERIVSKVILICQEPLPNKTYFLHGDFEGKRSFWVSRNIRIIYAYCRQCRQLNHIELNNCQGCSDLQDETVVFFTFDFHDKVYKS